MDDKERAERQEWASLHQAWQIAHQDALKARFNLTEKYKACAARQGPGPSDAEEARAEVLERDAEFKRHLADDFIKKLFG